MEMLGLGVVAACMFVGVSVGSVLARALGIAGDVGGVGFAMLLLVLVTNFYKLDEKVRNGIQFVSNLYIPIIVAMAAVQNVAGAVAGGMAAILAGGVATVASFFLVPVLSRMGSSDGSRRGKTQ